MTKANYTLQTTIGEPMSRSAVRGLREWPENYQSAEMKTPETGRMILELQRYCRGERDGVSILVAGQRGAGKTTLVKQAIEEVISTSKHLIPLPILLHGPTLIDPDEDMSSHEDDGLSRSKTATTGEATRAKELAMRQIIAALYRELCRVIYDAWEYAAEESPDGRGTVTELLELRTHLDLALDWAPRASWLRTIWARAGFLHSGVAFYLTAANRMSQGNHLRPSRIAGPSGDQGLREIRALTACGDAYRVIVGTTKEVQELKTTGQKREQSKSQPAAASEETGSKSSEKSGEAGGGADKNKLLVQKLAPPALGVLAGGLGLLPNQEAGDIFMALAIGALVWLVSWLAVTRTTDRQSSQELRRTLTTEPKWDAARIEREFPKLLARVKDAGFAPIFVLDEVDKVDDAPSKLERFLRFTKHLVTAEAAFLFLTNRDYYERLILQERQSSNNLPVKTFFTYRIFVRYEPDDYRRFILRRVTGTWPHNQQDNYRLGLIAWATILMYRSAMLPFDFNRHLMLMVDKYGHFVADKQRPDAPFRDRGSRQQLAMQLGIEIITRDPAVRARIEELPFYAQYIYDTLYYVRQLHEEGRIPTDAPIDQPPGFVVTVESLRRHLWHRARGKENERMPENFMPPEDINFLFDLLKRYAELLSAPARIRQEIMRHASDPSEQDLDSPIRREMWIELARAIDASRPIVELVFSDEGGRRA